MLTVVKRSEEEFNEFISREWGVVSGLAVYDDEPIVLEPYQQSFLNNQSRFRWVTKARQVGLSFLFALEALARCHLRKNHSAYFVSYNLDEAKEKILTARQIYDCLPLEYQKPLVNDAKTEPAFESNGASSGLSRIMSLPCPEPRGKHGDFSLDELAHYMGDKKIYSGSTALIARSRGQLTGCSAPLGRRGIFWEIAREEIRRYPHHHRQEVPLVAVSVSEADMPRVAHDFNNMLTVIVSYSGDSYH